MANVPAALRIFSYRPDTVTQGFVSSARKIIRKSVLEGRERSRASGVPNLPLIFSYEPAPMFLYGSKVQLRSKSMFGGLFGAPSYIPVAAPTPFPELLVQTWRGPESSANSDKPVKEPPLESFECEYEHIRHPLESELTTYVGPGHLAVDVTVDLRSRPRESSTEQRFQDDLAKAMVRFVRNIVPGIPTPKIFPGEGVWVPERAAGRNQERPFLNRIAHIFVHIDHADDIAHLCVILNVEGASSLASLTDATSPWAALQDMGIEHTTSTSIAAELGDTGHQLGRRKKNLALQLTQVMLVDKVSQCLGYRPPKVSTVEEMLGDDFGQRGRSGGLGWIVIPDLFFFL